MEAGYTLGMAGFAVMLAVFFVASMANILWRELGCWFLRNQRMFYVAMAVGALLILAGMLTGCASDPAKPRTEAEMFPYRNQDSRVGLVVNTGTAPSNLYIYDQANRLVEQVYLSGAERFVLSPYTNQPYPQYWARLLKPGCYRVEVWPFFHQARLIPPQMVRVDLPKQIYSVCVGNNPSAYWYGGQHWGWLLQIGTNIPDGATGLPLIQVVNPLGNH